MLAVVLTTILFWILPIRDIRRTREVRNISTADNPDVKLDENTVKAWKMGRLAAKKMWVSFGTALIIASMLNWVVDNFWGENGVSPDSQLAAFFNGVVIVLIVVGLIGFAVGLIKDGKNNKKYLGQFFVNF